MDGVESRGVFNTIDVLDLSARPVMLWSAVKPEWTSWDILRATNKLSKIDCHTPQDVMEWRERKWLSTWNHAGVASVCEHEPSP